MVTHCLRGRTPIYGQEFKKSSISKPFPIGAPLILDAETGHGKHVVELGFDVYGIDISASGIELGRESYPHLKLAVGNVYDDLAETYGQFPLVVSLEVIEHCFDPRRFVKTFYNLIAPEGIGILSTPYHGYWKNLALAVSGKWDDHLTVLWDGGHIKFFSTSTLSTMLAECGFKHSIHVCGPNCAICKIDDCNGAEAVKKFKY